MNNETVVRSWNDASFRATFSANELALMPPNPAGSVLLSDQQLMGEDGAITSPVCAVITITLITYSMFASCYGC